VPIRLARDSSRRYPLPFQVNSLKLAGLFPSENR
jgi:hypothetical protein